MDLLDRESCNKFILKNLCFLAPAFLAAGISVATIAVNNWLETDRVAREARAITNGNTSAIDSLTNEVRETNDMVRVIGEDLSYVKGQLAPARSASSGTVAMETAP